MKKFRILLIVLCIFFINTNVYAESVKMQDGDYELVCTYGDGLELTISKTAVFLQNASTDQSSLNTQESVSFYLGDARNTYDTEGNVTAYNSYKILENGKCPKKLYPYTEYEEVETGQDEDGDPVYDEISHHYYTTKANANYKTVDIYECHCGATQVMEDRRLPENIKEEIVRNSGYVLDYSDLTIYNYFKKNGESLHVLGLPISIDRDTATRYCKETYKSTCSSGAYAITSSTKDVTKSGWSNGRNVVSLASEEAYLTSTKVTKICDYESSTDIPTSTAQTASIYLYDNIAFLEMGGRVTPLQNRPSDCPYTGESTGETPTVYINDPTPKSIANSAVNVKYNAVRYKIYNDSDKCKAENEGNECVALKYIGSRNGDGDISSSQEVCKFIGNRTATLIRDIVSWLRVLVPALVIVLIGLDITKMVLAGNLQEELPKKKKSIIIRLIIMLIFFFLPLFVVLIIDLINLSPDVNIGDVRCLFFN